MNERLAFGSRESCVQRKIVRLNTNAPMKNRVNSEIATFGIFASTQ